jgi:hypothetical protein
LVPAREADGHWITHRSGDNDGADGEHDGSAEGEPWHAVTTAAAA